MTDKTRPVYSIGVAAELLGLHPRTLRLYEDAGLLKPKRRNTRRLFSEHDLAWIRCIRYLLHEKGLNQEGLRRLLALRPCWELRRCPPGDSAVCPARRERTCPCWHLPVVSSNGRRRCHDCPIYLSAPDYLCTREELEALAREEG